MVRLAAGLARTRSEGRDLKQDLEDHDHRLRSLEVLTWELINTFSHELRTPLGVLKAYVSMLEDGSIDQERNSAVVAILSHKLDEINVMIEGPSLITPSEPSMQSDHPRLLRAVRKPRGQPG